MNWKRYDIIQISSDFIPHSNYLTLDALNNFTLPNIISNIKPKPQRILQDWEYFFTQEGNNMITILERDQLSSPAKFTITKTANEDYMKLAYEEFKTVYPKISFYDFCFFTDFVDSTYPNLFSTYYYFRGLLWREDSFLQIIPPTIELYIGSVFQYQLI